MHYQQDNPQNHEERAGIYEHVKRRDKLAESAEKSGKIPMRHEYEQQYQ